MSREIKFNKVLGGLIKERKVNRQDLADGIGTSRESVNSWTCKNYKVPSVFMIMKIADYFDVSLDYLMYGEEYMVTEKDLSVEQRMAIKIAIDCMERNFKRNFNRMIVCQDKRVGFGEAINILTDMVTIEEQNK